MWRSISVFDMCSLFFFFVKQKTAYEMRISDWSSDVCSSDLAWLGAATDQRHRTGGVMGGSKRPLTPACRVERAAADRRDGGHFQRFSICGRRQPIGRGSCRERGWQDV